MKSISRWCAICLQRRRARGRYIESINNHILTGELYKALKDAKKLIAYEEELVNHAKRGTSLRSGSASRSSIRVSWKLICC